LTATGIILNNTVMFQQTVTMTKSATELTTHTIKLMTTNHLHKRMSMNGAVIPCNRELTSLVLWS